MLSVSVFDRLPQTSGPPVLSEVGGLVAVADLKLVERLNLPSTLSITCLPSRQETEVLDRFLDLTFQSTELWVYDDGDVLFAGPLLGYSPGLDGDDISWQITAEDLLGYLKRMRVEPDGPDLNYVGVDQATIAKNLIDYWQNLPYGHYGIDTTGVGTTGVLRDRSYPALDAHLIAQRISELAAVENGFDFRVDSETRDFVVHYPFRGIDRTSTVIIDARSIIDPSAQISAGPEDVISDGYAVGDGVVGHAHDPVLRSRIGRAGFASSFSGVVDQPTIDDHAIRLLSQRSTQLHNPAKVLYPIAVGWSDFDVGDLVEFSYDYGGGLLVEERRVSERELGVTRDGAAAISVVLV